MGPEETEPAGERGNEVGLQVGIQGSGAIDFGNGSPGKGLTGVRSISVQLTQFDCIDERAGR